MITIRFKNFSIEIKPVILRNLTDSFLLFCSVERKIRGEGKVFFWHYKLVIWFTYYRDILQYTESYEFENIIIWPIILFLFSYSLSLLNKEGERKEKG